jgi:hypothetical protein
MRVREEYEGLVVALGIDLVAFGIPLALKLLL